MLKLAKKIKQSEHQKLDISPSVARLSNRNYPFLGQFLESSLSLIQIDPSFDIGEVISQYPKPQSKHSQDCSVLEYLLFIYLLRFYLFIFREGNGGRKSASNINVQEKHGLAASSMPPTRDLAGRLGVFPDLQVCGTMPNPLSHTSQGCNSFKRG